MRLATLFLLASAVWAQDAATTFAVASVKPSASLVGPDYNNRLIFEPGALSARNATLRRLIAEAYGLQLRQVVGPAWLDRNEYDLDAKAGSPATPAQLRAMLAALLAERFGLDQHRETRKLKVYELVVDKGGPKIQPVEAGAANAAATWPRFHRELSRFADLLAVQLTVSLPDDPTRPGLAAATPAQVLDRTNLSDVYEFDVDVRPDGSDLFTLWQRRLREELGLRLVSTTADVPVLVVDRAAQVPAAN
jgi:uncharacterized protein (TIGR03435 family)